MFYLIVFVALCFVFGALRALAREMDKLPDMDRRDEE